MILYITISFFILVLILPTYWAFGLSFLFQSIYFQNGTTDISSYGYLVILLRLIISSKIDFSKLVKNYSTIRLFIFILIVSMIWSVSWGANAREFVLANFRMLISLIIFSNFIKEVKQTQFLIYFILPSFCLLSLNNYLLANELHPFFETTKEFGRLSGRTITGENLNSNQAAYTVFSLFIMSFLFKAFHPEERKFFSRWVIPLMLFLVLIVSGSLGSRTVIFSAILIFPMLYFDLRVIIPFTFLIIFLINIDFSTIELPLIGEESNQRIRDISTEELSKDSEMSRAVIYSSGLRILFDNFIFGIGTGKILETMSQSNYLSDAMMLHNAYLDLSIQFGLIGIFISIWIIYLGVRITTANLNLGFVYFVAILLPNFGHNFFQISMTPFLMLLIEYYSSILKINRNTQRA